MPDVITCPSCKREISRRCIYCPSCGDAISDVPAAITLDLLDSLRDDDLPDVIFQYMCKLLEQRGCWNLKGPHERDVLHALPRGIRAGYTLSVLDGEVYNGGFYQWFTNSSGKITDLTLDDLRLIGTVKHAELIHEAIALNRRLESKYPSYEQRWDQSEQTPGCINRDDFWSDVDANFMPEFDRLSSAFYALQESDSLWPHFAHYVRRRPSTCLHGREK